MGCSERPEAVHLLVPRRHRGLRRPTGVVIHTRHDDEEVAIVWRDGLPLTAPARILVDVVDNLQPEQRPKDLVGILLIAVVMVTRGRRFESVRGSADTRVQPI